MFTRNYLVLFLLLAGAPIKNGSVHAALFTGQDSEVRIEAAADPIRASSSPDLNHTVSWSETIRYCTTIATLQVVVSPLLNANTTAIAPKCWETLKALNADRVRFASWFIYPQVSVPELDPPNVTSRTTSWDFTGLQSQLDPFMASVNSSVLCISTMPLWFFSSPWNVTWYKKEPNQLEWGYGTTGEFQPNTTLNAAGYFARIADWLINGEMTDEFGNKKTGGPKYGDKIKWWEVLNEPEGELRAGSQGPQAYTALFDAVVSEIRSVADPNHRLKFQGLALGAHGERKTWWTEFLTHQNHIASTVDALNSASFHFYSLPQHKTDNATWSYTMFETVDVFEDEVRRIVALRDELSPNTELSVDELGVILPSNNPDLIWNDLYFNGANGVYTYAYAMLSEYGIDVAGCSQLAGMPVIPEWQIPMAQNPSVSMVNWTNGEGNARYWGLKLIMEELAVGDRIVPSHVPSRTKMCGAIWNFNFLGINPAHVVNLQCEGEGSYISGFDQVNILDQLGDCDSGFHARSQNCTDKGTLMTYVESHCLGRRSCSVDMSDAKLYYNGNSSAACPERVRMVVEATCTTASGTPGQGRATNSNYLGDRIFTQARECVDGKKKILFVNKNNDYATLHLPELMGATVKIVDSYRAAATKQMSASETSLTLKPFATGVIILP